MRINPTNEFSRLAAVALLAVLAACGGADEESDVPGESEEALSVSSYSFVSLRRDARRCMAPLCGGYWAKDLNRRTAEVYVNGLDFGPSGLDAATRALALEGDGLVVRGRLGKRETRFNTRPLLVLAAWRGLPGVAPSASDLFFQAAPRSPQINCVTAPCPNLRATRLGSSAKPYISGVDAELATMPLVQQGWLEHEVVHRDAIVAGQILAGRTFPGGSEQILVATQVYLKLPAKNESCPQVRLAPCPEGESWAFTRDARRCVLPVGCEPSRMCTLGIPTCEEGYVLRSWPGAGGCRAYACDPAFSVAVPE
jgi:hypothetical protein